MKLKKGTDVFLLEIKDANEYFLIPLKSIAGKTLLKALNLCAGDPALDDTGHTDPDAGDTLVISRYRLPKDQIIGDGGE